MLSHLRFHRRGPPTTSSPDHHQQPTLLPSPLSSGSDTAVLSPAISSTADGTSSALPPTLPPITRVTSSESQHYVEMSHQPDGRPQYRNHDSGFIGGVALTKYRRELEPPPADKQQPATSNAPARQRPVPTPIDTNVPTRPPPQVLTQTRTTSFSTPTDLQNATPNIVGRRPAGMRLTSEPAMPPYPPSNPEPQKGKKGLPFLKNPMSTLLMRRKTNQNAPDLVPLPIASQKEEPTYDPRIKGTRVHDFSAPRRKNVAPTKSPIPPSEFGQTTYARPGTQTLPYSHSQPNFSSVSPDSQSQDPSPPPLQMSESYDGGFTSAEAQTPPAPPYSPNPASLHHESPSSSVYSQPSQASRPIDSPIEELPRTAPSTRTNKSRKVSIVSDTMGRDRISSIPKHMKSTSSRFSFDMTGAGQQEKIMEERHRQREAEKQVTEAAYPRDSRFDDFDEDGFDYDAMMEDDGLEERIPGVNADWEEDDGFVNEINEDPDDDQENFAGFVFTRSTGPSSLASPQVPLFTPRDVDGNAIGFAQSKDSPHLHLESPLYPDSALGEQNPEQRLSGLGIQHQDADMPSIEEDLIHIGLAPAAQIDRAQGPGKSDDLYFDDRVPGFNNEFAEDLAAGPEGEPFDESIFDNDDTDQYGRPIAGAFAQAQSQRRAAQEEVVKRESDTNSRFSPQSRVSHSTAYTSVSEREPPEEPEKESPEDLKLLADSVILEENGLAAYQAALAAAAHQAAASGKFDWIAPSRERSESLDDASINNDATGYDDYDDLGYEDMNDFELDDDAIIAEANASALANDSDGWYGQEFGFYSAPVNQHGKDKNKEDEDETYTNGGFFGPKGLSDINRTKSGRVVCQEPNLTPITERSEYSNRNSVISLAKAPYTWGTPVQSPGLAQLAMMADRADDMSLSALMRLRNKAWGGSQASLASSKEGSPKSESGYLPMAPWTGNNNSLPSGQGHARKSSLNSAVSRDSEWTGSKSASPTMTANLSASSSGLADYLSVPIRGNTVSSAPAVVSQPEPIRTSNLPIADAHDGSASARSAVQENDGMSPSVARRPGHRHKNSAESISYTKEEDSGETRWVVERRIMTESGQVESIEREIIQGGRI